MKIAFYSSDAGCDKNLYTFYPGRFQCWKEALKNYPGVELGFFFSSRSTHMIETDLVSDQENISLFPVESQDASFMEYVENIASWKPDLAIAFGRPEIPFDWNPVRDSLIGEELEKRGIHTYCNKRDVSFDSFEKERLNSRLMELGFNVPKGIFVQNALLHAEKKYETIASNIYQEYILRAISELELPLIIKPSAGAGSVGIRVAHSLEEAKSLILAEKDVDLLVEEMIEGENFGAGIIRGDHGCMVFPPIIFNTTENKITDPFKSFKLGPVVKEEFKVEELNLMLHRLAEELDLKGASEVDLIYGRGKWYIIELNPRFSLLDQATAAMVKKTVPELHLALALEENLEDPKAEELCHAIDFKLQSLPKARLDALLQKFPSIVSVLDFFLEADGGEDIDYLEIVVQGKNKEILKEQLSLIQIELQDVLMLERIEMMKTAIDQYMEA